MRKFILIIFVCFISLVQTQAKDAPDSESCPSVDLNAGANSPFKQIPIYDQDGVGLCYAYAAAQMVDYYRIKNGDKGYGLTSPLYTSWATYYKSRTILKSDSLNTGGGYAESAVHAIKKSGSVASKKLKKN